MIATNFLPMIFSMLAFSAQAEHGVLAAEPDLGCRVNAGVPASGIRRHQPDASKTLVYERRCPSGDSPEAGR